jgi:hypothetical protein
MPAIGKDSREHPQSWFVLRFQKGKNQLEFYAEIRQMQDQGKRRAVIDMLLAECEKFGLKKRTRTNEPKDASTRISSPEKILVWNGDDEPDASKVRPAIKGKLDDLFPKLDLLPQALQKALQSTDAGGS